ncbi:metallophosphoesterase [Massilia sp. Dwa41.01b]|uniref:metallophosphoesterase n=1 Tax=Massilia sp. Dwa41.01b TaxID=2709302 RepID=UPI001E5CF0DB|nr:metallophosphoesterase [Massilia sp. Dwa41.01b]
MLLLGDQVDDAPLGEARLAEVLHGITAPRGVWAVTGNHEYYGDAATTMAEFKAGGVHWLRDEAVTLVPGLRLAGIDDIGRTMHARGDVTAGLVRTLAQPLPDVASGAASGATILLSHIPADAVIREAAAHGVGLMLSGHTHGGQVWPFNYLVAQRFPQVVGRHLVGDMTLVISRGAGSWGPRMRLWRPGEIVKLTLRAPH